MIIRQMSAKIKCPVCRKVHFWNRRQAIAFGEGKSVLLPCVFCGTNYWAKKSGLGVVINEEREKDYGLFSETVSGK